MAVRRAPHVTVPVLAAVCAALGCARGAEHEVYDKFLIVTSPANGKVGYVRVPLGQQGARLHVEDLITTGLVHPQGIAVNPVMRILFVADPDKGQILAYKLSYHRNQTLSASRLDASVDGVESRWVAVDSRGGIYFTVEGLDLVQHVPVNHNYFRSSRLGSSRAPKMPQPTTMYDEKSYALSPGGITTDGQNIYWTNKAQAQASASIVKGTKKASGLRAQSVHALANNSAMNFGICTAHDNLFFTRNDNVIYGVKKAGGQVVAVSRDLDRPRGCAWDGDGTLFVADRSKDAVFSFPSKMRDIRPAAVTKLVNYEGAFGLAVLNVPQRSAALMCGPLIAAVAVLMHAAFSP